MSRHPAAKCSVAPPPDSPGTPEGHFLVYSVIARVDGKDFAADDPHLKVIVYDIVEKYLRDHVILEWSIDRSHA